MTIYLRPEGITPVLLLFQFHKDRNCCCCCFYSHNDVLQLALRNVGISAVMCSHSPNDVPHEPQRNVIIAALRGAVRPSKGMPDNCLFKLVIIDFYNKCGC